LCFTDAPYFDRAMVAHRSAIPRVRRPEEVQ
jgi:hypothetical protein